MKNSKYTTSLESQKLEKQKAFFIEQMINHYNWENVFNMFQESDDFLLCELKAHVSNEIFDTLQEIKEEK